MRTKRVRKAITKFLLLRENDPPTTSEIREWLAMNTKHGVKNHSLCNILGRDPNYECVGQKKTAGRHKNYKESQWKLKKKEVEDETS